MEIFINGEQGLASTDSNVKLGELFDYLRQELAKQRVVVRSLALDGKEVFPDDDPALRGKMSDAYQRLDVEAAPVEVVAVDILAELHGQMPLLSEEAVRVTTLFQSGELPKAKEALGRLNNTVLYVVQALGSIRQTFNISLADVGDAQSPVEPMLKALGENLKSLAESLDQQDFATAGDILEFDLAPGLKGLSALVGRMHTHVTAKMNAMNTAQPGGAQPGAES